MTFVTHPLTQPTPNLFCRRPDIWLFSGSTFVAGSLQVQNVAAKGSLATCYPPSIRHRLSPLNRPGSTALEAIKMYVISSTARAELVTGGWARVVDSSRFQDKTGCDVGSRRKCIMTTLIYFPSGGSGPPLYRVR